MTIYANHYIHAQSNIYNYKLVAVRNVVIAMQEWAQTDNRTQIDNREYDPLHKLLSKLRVQIYIKIPSCFDSNCTYTCTNIICLRIQYAWSLKLCIVMQLYCDELISDFPYKGIFRSARSAADTAIAAILWEPTGHHEIIKNLSSQV
jgi:hypothetical protein